MHSNPGTRDGSDTILVTEDNRLCRIANGDHGDDDDKKNA